jgi:dTDP-L-rhamnose 4-epimerase
MPRTPWTVSPIGAALTGRTVKYERILVTGGAGFIGSHVVELLRQQGRHVRVLDVLEAPTHQRQPRFPAGVEFLQGDIRSKIDVDRAVESMDAVIHLAATGGFTPDISHYLETNSVGTAHLMEAARRTGVRRMVVASSVAVYGEGAYRCSRHGLQFPLARRNEVLEKGLWEPPCPVCGGPLEPVCTPEEKPVAPRSPYSISKYVQERLILGSDIPGTALRFFLTYGPRQSLTNPYTGIVSIFTSRLLNDAPPILYEDGKQTRDFVYVEDVARAIVHVLESEAAVGQVYNVGTGKGTSVFELAGLLAELYGKRVEPSIPGQYRPGEARHCVADIRKLSELGWNPKVSLREGLRRTVDWASSQGEVQDHLAKALSGLRESGVVRAVEFPRSAAAEGLSVIIPAYNEAGNLPPMIERTVAHLPGIVDDFEIIVVNDGSMDGTGAIADRLAAENKRVSVVHHPVNLGFGAAIRSGYLRARKDWVASVPADQQFDIRDLERLWRNRREVDFVSGRRVGRRDPWSRRLISALYNRGMRVVFGVRLDDINWIKLWRRSIFDRIRIESRGFGIDAEITVKARELNLRFTQVDLPHHPRIWGKTTCLRWGTIYRTAVELLRVPKLVRRMKQDLDGSPER